MLVEITGFDYYATYRGKDSLTQNYILLGFIPPVCAKTYHQIRRNYKMGFLNLFKKKGATGKIYLPIFEVEPITLLNDAKKISDNYQIDKFIDYEYSSSVVYANLFDTFTFKVFSNSRDFEVGYLPQINLTAIIKQAGIQNIGSAENLVNTLNSILKANEPFTDIDMGRIIDGVWRGRSYFINKKGGIDKSASVGSFLLTFHLDDKKFEFSLIGYNHINLKR